MIALIVAMDRHGGIGYRNAMPWKIPGELKRFKEITLNHTVVMGRKTYESIGHPLVDRTNVVVTRDHHWSAEGVVVIHDLTSFLSKCASQGETVYIIGGASLYEAAMPYVSTLIISVVDGDYACDTYFPDIDWSRFKAVEVNAFKGFIQTRYERISV